MLKVVYTIYRFVIHKMVDPIDLDLLRRWLVLSLRGGQDSLHTPRQDAPGEQHFTPAAQALKPDICAQTDDFPFVAAARMRLAQTHPVVELQVRQHRGHYNMDAGQVRMV